MSSAQQGIAKWFWTAEQDALLREWAASVKTKEIARRLGRSVSAVRSRASAHGIPMRFPFKYMGGERGGRNVPASRSLHVRNLEWAAGFLEGEGCFRNTGTTELVEAKQVNLEPVNRLLAVFGGKILHQSLEYVRRRGGKANDVWIWKVCGGRARGVMLTLYGLLSAKRQGQIRKAIT